MLAITGVPGACEKATAWAAALILLQEVAELVCFSWGWWMNMTISISGGTPKLMVYIGSSQSKMDSYLGYPHFRKPPYGLLNHLPQEEADTHH